VLLCLLTFEVCLGCINTDEDLINGFLREYEEVVSGWNVSFGSYTLRCR